MRAFNINQTLKINFNKKSINDIKSYDDFAKMIDK